MLHKKFYDLVWDAGSAHLLLIELATGLGSFLIWKAGIAARSYHRRGVTVGTGLSRRGCSGPPLPLL